MILMPFIEGNHTSCDQTPPSANLLLARKDSTTIKCKRKTFLAQEHRIARQELQNKRRSRVLCNIVLQKTGKKLLNLDLFLQPPQCEGGECECEGSPSCNLCNKKHNYIKFNVKFLLLASHSVFLDRNAEITVLLCTFATS